MQLTTIKDVFSDFFNLVIVCKDLNQGMEELVPISKCLTSNEYTVKDSFAFAEEIVEQSSGFMGSLDVDFLDYWHLR